MLQFGPGGAVTAAWTGFFKDHATANGTVLTDVYVVDDATWIVAGYVKPASNICSSVVAKLGVTTVNETPTLNVQDLSVQERGELCGVAAVALAPNRKYAQRRTALGALASLTLTWHLPRPCLLSRHRRTLVVSDVKATNGKQSTLTVRAYALDSLNKGAYLRGGRGRGYRVEEALP